MSKIQLVYQLNNKQLKVLYLQKGSISNMLRTLGINQDPRCRKIVSERLCKIFGNNNHSTKHRPKVEYSIAEIRRLASKVSSVTALLQNLKLQPVGNNITRYRQLLTKHNISLLPHQTKTWSDEKVYCENSSFDRRSLSARVKRDKWLNSTCDKCDNGGIWNRTPLVLHLDHKNGKNNDHRKTNLRWLCPNCHSQTHTYGGRNNKNKSR